LAVSVESYEHAVTPARARFRAAPAVRRIQDPEIGPQGLHAFLIYFSALGVGMTEPVEGWIRRAGQATESLGATTLGKALQGHARAEADHHLLMIDDLGRLCDRWNARYRPDLHRQPLLDSEWPDSVHRYRGLHEDVIAGAEPYAQIAIENEIEMLSVAVGPGLLANVERLLGPDVLADLSFLTGHVELDVGHTKFNRRQLAAFLDERPFALDALVAAGIAALDAYLEFIGDCVARADAVDARVA
jgi:hypothetical protein